MYLCVPTDSVLIWAIVFFASTTLILIFKKEASPATANVVDYDDHGLGLKESYTRLWQIIKTAPVRKIALIFFFYEASYSHHHSLYSAAYSSSESNARVYDAAGGAGTVQRRRTAKTDRRWSV